jgi:hypothetical protein
MHTKVYCSLKDYQRRFSNIAHRELTCFEMTSGDRGVNFVTSTSTSGIASAMGSSSSSESDASSGFCRVSSPDITVMTVVKV